LNVEKLKPEAGEHASANHIGDDDGGNSGKAELVCGHEGVCLVS
jgi:hypothetical protein